jgi:hypothetical protein
MQQIFSRQALFDRVWSEPIRDVAATLTLSDVALAKVCRQYDIPIPWRGTVTEFSRRWSKEATGIHQRVVTDRRGRWRMRSTTLDASVLGEPVRS